MRVLRLTEATARNDARLFVRFDDGTSGEIDLSDCLFGPIFEPLKDPAFFAQVTVDEYGAPTWPNGADLAPQSQVRSMAAIELAIEHSEETRLLIAEVPVFVDEMRPAPRLDHHPQHKSQHNWHRPN